MIDSQVRALRKRQAIGGFVRGDREGAYWGIRTDIRNYGLGDALPCPTDKTLDLARTPTRLKSMDRGAAGAADQLGLRRLRRGDAPPRRS